MSRRLYRCRDNRVLAGVAAGVAEYFDVDPSLVRLFWFLSIFAYGIGILVYIVMAVIVPLEPLTAEEAAALEAAGPDGHRHANRDSGRAVTFIGLGLIVLGSMALLNMLVPGWPAVGRYLWPAFIIGIGVLLVAGAFRRTQRES